MTDQGVAQNVLPTTTRSAEETMALGEQIGQSLKRGDIVALFGDLGAGKTHLVKGICRAVGVDENRVCSPTFTLVQEYHGGKIPVYHFDAYRIESMDEIYDLGYDTYFYGDGLTIVEWADRIEAILPPDAICIMMRHAGSELREIEICPGK